MQPTVPPEKPIPPRLDGANEKEGALTILLQAPLGVVGTGDSPILYYELRRSGGEKETLDISLRGEIHNATVDAPSTTETVILRSLTKGRIYLFKVRFANLVGWSEYSEIVAMKCCDFALPPVSPTNLRRDHDAT